VNEHVRLQMKKDANDIAKGTEKYFEEKYIQIDVLFFYLIEM
jgi:hypothetical protein